MQSDTFDLDSFIGYAPSKTENVSTDRLAAILGVSARSITELARKGIIERTGRGEYPLWESIASYCAQIREQAAGRSNSTSLTAERLRLAREQADALEMKNAATRGEMLSGKSVESEWSAILRDVRAGMLAVSTRVQQRLPHLTAHDVSEIDHEIRATLFEIANDGA